MLAGVADPRVDSNDKIPNPNVTVFEWLNGLRGYRGRVATFGAWDVLPYIVNTKRSGVPAGDGYPPVPEPQTDRERAINEMADDLPPIWEGAPLDAPIMHAAIECLRTRRPRVLYVMLGETDEWAHERRYDLYLDAAFRADRFMRRVWEMVQGMPEYAGTTALVLATDHGRGATAGLDGPWPQGAGRRSDVVGGDGARHARRRRPRVGDRDDGAGGGDDRGAAWRGLPRRGAGRGVPAARRHEKR